MRQRKYRFPQKKIKFSLGVNLFKVLSILLIALYFVLLPVFVKKLIKISKVEYCNQYSECTTKKISNSYLDVRKEIEEELKNDVKIKDYLIQYKIPNTIKVETVIKTSKYMMKDSTGNLFMISNDGLIMGRSDHSDLPVLINKNIDLEIGKKISDKDLFALKILERVAKVNTIFNSEITKDSLEIKVDGGILVLFPLEGDVEVLSGSLKLIFSRLNDETEGIKMVNVHQIDLRFNNPVIR